MPTMTDDDKAPVIRIVRKKVVAGGHHGGAWKVAYADFVTAMMAFFLVMWICGLSKPMKQAIAAYFRDPSGLSKTTKGGRNPLSGGNEAMISAGKPAPVIPLDGKNPAEVEKLLIKKFETVEKEIVKQLEQSPDFRGMRNNIEVHLTEEGLRVELIEKRGSVFFELGSATLKPRTVAVLSVIAHQLGKLNNPVVVEGHTDSRPLNGLNGYSNWELSTDRANAARHAMEEHGLRNGQVGAVRGYADRKLLKPEDPMHFSNRRVSILVPYSMKD